MKQGTLLILIACALIASSCKEASTSLPAETPLTWEKTSYSGTGVSAIATYDSVIYVASTALWISRDNGTTWTSKPLPQLLYSPDAIVRQGSYLFIGGDGFGVYRSGDEGSTWTNANTGLTAPKHYVIALAVNGSALFAGTNEAGVFRSTDNGNTWTEVNNGHTSPIVEGLLIKDNVLFSMAPPALVNGVYKAGGVFVSSDNGDHWTIANNGRPDSTVFCMTAHGNQVMAVAQDSGVYVSSDNGNTWTKKSGSVRGAANIGSDGKNIYVLTALYSGTNYRSNMLKSADAGATWEDISAEVGLKADSLSRGFFSSNSKYLFAGIGYQVWRHSR